MIALALSVSLWGSFATYLHKANCPIDSWSTWVVCQEVALAAKTVGGPIRITTTLAWSESRFFPERVSSVGAVGPLQVLPRYWCPGGGVDRCDLTLAGALAVKTLVNRYGAERGLCHFAAGNVCNARALRYAQYILRRTKHRR
jgi:hypothetical protein